MKTHEEMVQEWMKEPEFKRQYDALEAEFTVLDELLKARQAAGLTLEEMDKHIIKKAKVLAIAQIEPVTGHESHSPSPATIRPHHIEFDSFTVWLRGDHDHHMVTYHDGQWNCDCGFFDSRGDCAHIRAMELVLEGMVELHT
jgi:hypothetical protein